MKRYIFLHGQPGVENQTVHGVTMLLLLMLAFVLGGNAAVAATEAPTFTPAAGTYSGTISVSITTPTGCKTYYTTDGATPTAKSTLYSSPLQVKTTTTVKAIAISYDGTASSVATADYTIIPRGSGDDYNPSSPSDPGVLYNLTLTASPSDGGSVSPSGRNQYVAGAKVSCYAYNSSNFRFVRWTEDGETVSTSSSFTYTMPERAASLTAVFEYSPGNPADPDSMGLRRRVFLEASPSDAGSFSVSSGTYYEVGTSFSVRAYTNSNFTFKGWQRNGQTISVQNPISLKMEESDIYLTAIYEYTPGNPGDPSRNSWDATTGTLIIDYFQTGSISSAINALVSDRSLVKKIIVSGAANSSDLRNLSSFTACDTLDLSRVTGLTSLSSYAFSSSSKFATIILPSTITQIDYRAFNYCTTTTEIVVYATEPPTVTNNSSKFSGLPDGVKISVPPTSVDAYKAANVWKNYTIQPIEGGVFPPVLNGVEATCTTTDADKWNNVASAHPFSLSGTYTNASGNNGSIYYSVDNGAWALLADNVANGTTFNKNVTATFTKGLSTHTIRLYALDSDDQRSGESVITFDDAASLLVNGLTAQSYTGKAVTLPSLTFSSATSGEQLTACEQFTCEYADNVNAGQAKVVVKGVYPYTIGQATHYFTIKAATLKGELKMVNDTTFTYNGQQQKPQVSFESYGTETLTEGKDYCIVYRDNLYPGTAYAVAEGMGNYQGEVRLGFTIEKGMPTYEDIISMLPDEDILYDGNAHYAKITQHDEGFGTCTQEYVDSNGQPAVPLRPGTYTLNLIFAEGEYYKAAKFEAVYTFTITAMNEADWAALKAFHTSANNGAGWKKAWIFTSDIASAGMLTGIKAVKGRVVAVELPNNNMKGKIGESLLSLPYLQKVDLQGNYFSDNVAEWSAFENQQLTEINLTGNSLTGDVTLLAGHFPNVSTLLLAGNSLDAVSKPLSTKIKTIELTGQNIKTAIVLNLQNIQATDLLLLVPTICLYNHAQRNYITTPTFTLTADGTDSWQATLAATSDGLALTSSDGHNIYKGKNGGDIQFQILNDNVTAQGTVFPVALTFLQGDADFSSVVDVRDLQSTINAAFDDTDGRPFNYTAANIITDEVINVQDVVGSVNLLLAQSTSAKTQRSAAMGKQESGDAAQLYVEDGKLMLTTPTAVAAIDMVLTDCTESKVQWLISKYGLVCSTKATADGLHVVAYSPTHATLPAGTTQLALLGNKNANVRKAMLADIKAQSVNVLTSKVTTGIDAEQCSEECLVNLYGQSLEIACGRSVANAVCTVYAIDGKKVASVAFKQLAEGKTKVDLSAQLPSGTYIVVVQAEGRKMSNSKIKL